VGWQIAITILLWLSLLAARIAWFLRTYVLYQRAFWLLCLFTPLIVAESVIVLMSTTRVTHIRMPPMLSQICIVAPRNQVLAMFSFGSPLILDGILLVLCLMRANRVTTGRDKSFARQLARDGKL
jgi:hypothetical protein